MKKIVSITLLLIILSISTSPTNALNFDYPGRFHPYTIIPAGFFAWGDYDQDGDPDLVTGCTYCYRNAHVFKNDPTGTFTEIAVLPCGWDIQGQSQPWGDYDQDDYLDIVLPSRGASYLYHYNKDNGTFEKVSNPFPIQYSGGAWFQWGDVDGINGPDLVLIGVNSSGVFINDGNGYFIKSQILPNRDNHSGDLGDYDNDGDLDLVLTGKTPGGPGPWHFEIYNNVGGVLALEITLPGIAGSGTQWVDYDNDGLLDIFVIGKDSNLDSHVELWNQSPIGTFIRDSSQPALDAFQSLEPLPTNLGVAAFGDYNNDTYQDLFLTINLAEGGCRTTTFANNHSGTLKSDLSSGIDNHICHFYPSFSDFDLDGDIDLAAWKEWRTVIFSNTGFKLYLPLSQK